MENKLRSTFDKIHVEPELKEKTADFIKAEIQKRSRTNRFFRMRLAAVCASLALFLIMGGVSYRLYFTPNTYVDMDVNPSIALTLNRFGRVLEAGAYNEDGAVILQSVDIRHETYEQAVQTLLAEMIGQGYLKTDGLVSVTIQTDNNSTEQKMLGEIQQSVDTLLVSRNFAASADVFAVSQEVRDCAHDNNLSPAKYLAITQLQEVDPTASYEKCAEHSISEIKQLTEEHCGEHHEGEEDNKDADDAQTNHNSVQEEHHKEKEGHHE